jgi:hypothetical protein
VASGWCRNAAGVYVMPKRKQQLLIKHRAVKFFNPQALSAWLEDRTILEHTAGAIFFQ